MKDGFFPDSACTPKLYGETHEDKLYAKLNSNICYVYGGGGNSGTQQVQSQVTQTNLPAYVQPYFEQVLQRGLFESARPYQEYGGQRLAQFAPEETQTQRNIMGLGRPEQIGMATDIARQVGYANMPSGMDIAGQFQPGAISPTYQASQFQTGYAPGQFEAGYQAGQVGPGYQAELYSPQFQASRFQSGYAPTEFQPGFQAQFYQPQYQAGQVGPGFEAGSLAAPGAMETYMSPYQQAVTDIEKREATRASELQRPTMGAEAARVGALGGTRSALLEAERQRNLGQQLGDIQARGSQQAFEQARAGFEADRAARLQQSQYGLGAFQAQEAARQAQEQMRMQAFGMGAEERQFEAGLGFQAQQAADQARARAAQMGMDAQQQEEASRQAAEQFRQSAYSQRQQALQAQGQQGLAGFQAQEAARQQQAQFQLQAQQAGEQARQRAAELGLSAQQQTEAARQAQQQFQMQAQQFNVEQQRQRALLGLQGLGADQAGMAQRLGAAELLTGLGGQQQQLDLQRLAAQMGVGAERRGLMQRGLDIGYEDFLRQQAYGREQLGYLSNLLQGVPITPGSMVSTFGRVPTAEQQLLGGGLGALGLYQAFGGRQG